MKIIKNVITRIIALLICMGIVAYCATQCVSLVLKYESLDKNSSRDLIVEYSHEVNEVFEDAWIYAATMMDEEFLSKPELKQSITDTLFDEKIIDADGYVIFDTRNFEVYIERDGISNLWIIDEGDDINERFDKNPDYTLTFADGSIYEWPEYLDFFDGNNNYGYKTADGFYYFYSAYSGQGYAFYDYEVTEENGYYIDELGATIYFNQDGSNPVESQNTIPLQMKTDEITIKIVPTAQTLENIQSRNVVHDNFEAECVEMITSLIPWVAVLLALTLFIILTAGFDTKEKKYRMISVDRIFLEFVLVIAAASVLGIAWLLCMYPFEISYVYSTGEYESLLYMLYGVLSPLLYAIALWCVATVVVRIRCKKLFTTSLIVRIIASLFLKLRESFIAKENLRNNAFLARFLIRVLVAVIAEILIIFVALGTENGIIFVILSLINAFVFILWNIADLNHITKLSEHISAISQGDYQKISVDEGVVTNSMHTKLNDISSGIELAVDRELKSERMKIDLVTNVSHDLKTPLTSIISYIDLLSKEELSPEASDYVKILEEKSHRLKDMVSDVFDLAKATSKTDVNLQRLDLAVLTEQVLGDLQDKIEKSDREIRKTIALSAAPIMADGKRLYRVLQNCIDNALKYSMPSTRIYIMLEQIENRAVLSFKNIASYEMTFTPEEITERFVRGDQSRTGDGNGLGLSIAKSFTEASGGEFEIIIEGDMFVSKISFELCGTQNPPTDE